MKALLKHMKTSNKKDLYETVLPMKNVKQYTTSYGGLLLRLNEINQLRTELSLTIRNNITLVVSHQQCQDISIYLDVCLKNNVVIS